MNRLLVVGAYALALFVGLACSLLHGAPGAQYSRFMREDRVLQRQRAGLLNYWNANIERPWFAANWERVEQEKTAE
ncbi:hypothetical protein AAVH_32640 [Aphelenchoides avenae]|nr:hypothetical protein AAVH_32640 [Aphelenchus avenae]